MKLRAVYWFFFPLLFGLSFYEKMEFISIKGIALNLLFLCILLVGLTVYVSLKERKLINITKGFFSIGDILFLIAILPLFTLSNYVLYFTAGTIFSLLIHAISLLLKSKNNTVPFAGYMSLLLIFYLLFESKITSLMLLSI